MGDFWGIEEGGVWNRVVFLVILKKMKIFCPSNCLKPCFHIQLFKDMFGMRFNSLKGNKSLFSYLFVLITNCHQFQYFNFSLG